MRHIERKEEVKANCGSSLKYNRERIHRPSIRTDDVKSKGVKAYSLCLGDIQGSLMLLYAPDLLNSEFQNRAD
jgi:hypothetical protein